MQRESETKGKREEGKVGSGVKEITTSLCAVQRVTVSSEISNISECRTNFLVSNFLVLLGDFV